MFYSGLVFLVSLFIAALIRDNNSKGVFITKIIILILSTICIIVFIVGVQIGKTTPSTTTRTYIVEITDAEIFPQLYDQGYTITHKHKAGNIYEITGPIFEDDPFEK